MSLVRFDSAGVEFTSSAPTFCAVGSKLEESLFLKLGAKTDIPVSLDWPAVKMTVSVFRLYRQKQATDEEFVEFCRLRRGAAKHTLDALLLLPVSLRLTTLSAISLLKGGSRGPFLGGWMQVLAEGT